MKIATKINSKENENKERNQRTYSPSGFSWNLWNQNKDEGCTITQMKVKE